MTVCRLLQLAHFIIESLGSNIYFNSCEPGCFLFRADLFAPRLALKELALWSSLGFFSNSKHKRNIIPFLLPLAYFSLLSPNYREHLQPHRRCDLVKFLSILCIKTNESKYKIKSENGLFFNPSWLPPLHTFSIQQFCIQQFFWNSTSNNIRCS